MQRLHLFLDPLVSLCLTGPLPLRISYLHTIPLESLSHFSLGQVLLLSAQRDASGLTLTAASHVIIMEPQPDVAVELQMIGRVHRIGQTRQTHVHRLVAAGSFEAPLAEERQGRWSHSLL